MKPYVPTSLRTTILSAADRGDDPFGLRPTHRDQSPRIGLAIVEGLTNPTPDGCRHMADRLRQHYEGGLVSGLDRMTAEMIAGIGISPLSLAWMAVINGRYAAIEDDGRGEKLRLDAATSCASEYCLTYVEIAPGIEWHSHGTLILPEPPETIMNAAVGMRLSALVQHPALDKRDITIIDLSEDVGDGQAGFVTDASSIPVTVDDLLGIAVQCRMESVP